MRSFIIKLVVFFAPFVMAMLLVIAVGIQIGELIPEPLIIQMLQDEETDFIYQPHWQAKNHIYFKYHSVEARSPSILVIGSSRMYFFREQFVNRQPSQFYNASAPNFDPYEMSQFIEGLANQSALPSVILLGIDLPYFNPNHVNTQLVSNRVSNIVPEPGIKNELDRLIEALFSLTQTLSSNPRELANLIHYSTKFQDYRPLGLTSVQTNKGYRNDGSMYLGNNLESSINSRLKSHENAYEEQDWMYVSGNELDETTFDTFAHILQIAEDQGSVVIGIVLPYRQSYYTRMMESGNYEYIPAAIPRIETLFESYNAPLFNFISPQLVGGTDEELFDSWHPGELLSLRMFATTVREYPDIFDPYVDLESLDTVITNAQNPFYLLW